MFQILIIKHVYTNTNKTFAVYIETPGSNTTIYSIYYHDISRRRATNT